MFALWNGCVVKEVEQRGKGVSYYYYYSTTAAAAAFVLNAHRNNIALGIPTAAAIDVTGSRMPTK